MLQSPQAPRRDGEFLKREGLLFETIRSDRTADEKIRFQSEGVRFDRSSGFDRPRETYEFQTKNRRHPRANRSSLQCALPALSPADVAAPMTPNAHVTSVTMSAIASITTPVAVKAGKSAAFSRGTRVNQVRPRAAAMIFRPARRHGGDK